MPGNFQGFEYGDTVILHIDIKEAKGKNKIDYMLCHKRKGYLMVAPDAPTNKFFTINKTPRNYHSSILYYKDGIYRFESTRLLLTEKYSEQIIS